MWDRITKEQHGKDLEYAAAALERSMLDHDMHIPHIEYENINSAVMTAVCADKSADEFSYEEQIRRGVTRMLHDAPGIPRCDYSFALVINMLADGGHELQREVVNPVNI